MSKASHLEAVIYIKSMEKNLVEIFSFFVLYDVVFVGLVAPTDV